MANSIFAGRGWEVEYVYTPAERRTDYRDGASCPSSGESIDIVSVKFNDKLTDDYNEQYLIDMCLKDIQQQRGYYE